MNDHNRLLSALKKSRSFQDYTTYDESAYPDEQPADPWLKRNAWRMAWGAVLVVMVALLFVPLPQCASGWLASYRGGLAINIATSLLFLFIGEDLGYHFTKQHERVADRIRALSATQHERQLKERVDEFMRAGDWENIRLMQRTQNGLELAKLDYRISPIRDDALGPFVSHGHGSKMYAVLVEGFASKVDCDPQTGLPLDEQLAAEFKDSPIQIGHHHFLKFVDRRWHISSDAFAGGKKWPPFVFSTKTIVGLANETADAFVQNERARRERAQKDSP